MVDVHRLPRPVTDIGEWQMHGACHDMDSNVFFHPDQERGPIRTAREVRAKQVCQTCPVIEACRRHALSVREPYGVWGGMSEAERSTLLRRSDRAAALPTRARLRLAWSRPALG